MHLITERRQAARFRQLQSGEVRSFLRFLNMLQIFMKYRVLKCLVDKSKLLAINNTKRGKCENSFLAMFQIIETLITSHSIDTVIILMHLEVKSNRKLYIIIIYLF